MAKACLHNDITNLESYTLNSVSNSPTQLTRASSASWNALCLLGMLWRSLKKTSSSKKSILTMWIPDHVVVFRTTRWMRTMRHRVYNARISNLRATPLIRCVVPFYIYRLDGTLSLHTSFNIDSDIPAGLHYYQSSQFNL
jgi:hypothetical protein